MVELEYPTINHSTRTKKNHTLRIKQKSRRFILLHMEPSGTIKVGELKLRKLLENIFQTHFLQASLYVSGPWGSSLHCLAQVH